jgi:hypothetical protein
LAISVRLFHQPIENGKRGLTMNNEQPQTVIPGNGPGAEYVSTTAIWILLAFFCVVALGLLSSLFGLWPDSEPASPPASVAAAKPPSTGRPPSAGTTSDLTTDNTTAQTTENTTTDNATPGNPTAGNAAPSRKDTKPAGSTPSQATNKKDSETGFKIKQRTVLLLVLLAGALGGTLYSLISLAWYIGNRELKWSWVPSYIVRPLTAAALACIFFLTLVTGVWTDQTGKGQLWIIGFAALVGLFSKQGYEKLKAIFEAVLAPAPKGADTPKTVPAGGLGISPSSGPAAGGDIVQITGSGFTTATTVQFDTVAATSIHLNSPTLLHVVVPQHAPGQVNVTVTNPGNPSEVRTMKYTYT